MRIISLCLSLSQRSLVLVRPEGIPTWTVVSTWWEDPGWPLHVGIDLGEK